MREESAFRQELTLATCLIPLAIIDRISFEHHGLSKRAKDYGSAAVMRALLVWGMPWITLTWRLLAAS